VTASSELVARLQRELPTSQTQALRLAAQAVIDRILALEADKATLVEAGAKAIETMAGSRQGYRYCRYPSHRHLTDVQHRTDCRTSRHSRQTWRWQMMGGDFGWQVGGLLAKGGFWVGLSILTVGIFIGWMI